MTFSKLNMGQLVEGARGREDGIGEERMAGEGKARKGRREKKKKREKSTLMPLGRSHNDYKHEARTSFWPTPTTP